VRTFSDPGLDRPWSITAGPDGALWFTDLRHGTMRVSAIGRISTDGAIHLYTNERMLGDPVEITAGPDDALWFINYALGSIGRMSLDGDARDYGWDNDCGGAAAEAMTSAPDGTLWFVTYWDKIGRITTSKAHVATDCDSRHYAFGDGDSEYVDTPDITAAPDGTVWFSNYNYYRGSARSLIGRLTRDGRIRTFTDPGIRQPHGITVGPDGALWFADDHSIGRITADGAVTTYTGVTYPAQASITTAGPRTTR
jgi:virginiamycin B lyase